MKGHSPNELNWIEHLKKFTGGRLRLLMKRPLLWRSSLLFLILLTLCFGALNHLSRGKQAKSFIPFQPSWKECDRIITGDVSLSALNGLASSVSGHVSLDNCTQIRQAIDANPWPSREESAFPLAYAISTYDNTYQLLNLLRLIYRPHNLYCVHLDKKMPINKAFRLRRLLNCFPPNVFRIPDTERINVTWGYYSVLEAFLVCAKALGHNRNVQWRYLLNANEKELPLRTNWELVKILRNLNGANLVHATLEDPGKRIPGLKIPFNVKWHKGSFLVALKRDFVHYLFNSRHALTILGALKSEQHLLKVPDEMLFATLVYNPQLGAPGACDRITPHNKSDPTTWLHARYVIWDRASCSTKRMRNDVCILGRKDLSKLLRTPHLFANKFLMNVQPEAYECLSYWLLRKSEYEREKGTTDRGFDPSLYQKLYCSKHHL